MFERVALVHYHEIGLKGRNRTSFEKRLAANLRSAVEGLTEVGPQRVSSRVLIPISDPARTDEVVAAAAATPGVTSVSPAWVVEREFPAIFTAAENAVAEASAAAERPPRTFAIRARRSATDFEVTSDAMNVAIGDHIRVHSGLSVDLGHPDVTVHVEVVQAYAYVYALKVPGPGGLPSGTSGRVVSLLSAGIDSPVATWRIIKRGAVVIALHFSGRPATDDRSVRYVHELGEVLEATGGLARIHVVSFGDVQRAIALDSPAELRILLYRRMMVRVAEEVARREKARAIVTGESLGQVASQTLENVAAVDAAATLPVLRPLIGMDKNEIMADARRIGTFEASTQAHDDCCTVFMPRMPATHATIAQVEEGESRLDLPALVEASLATLEHRDYRCPAYGKARDTSAPTEAGPEEPAS